MHRACSCPSSSRLLHGVALVLSVLYIEHDLHGVDADDFEVVGFDLRSDGDIEMNGRLLVPENYDAQQSYPIVLFFHGLGDGGTDNRKQVEKNIGNLVAAATDREFFLYAPQLPSNTSWSSTRVTEAFHVIGDITSQYNIDVDRVYVTGLSLGGGGVWKSLDIFSEILAGSFPVAGVSGSVVMGANTVDEPIWAFHAVNDGTVGPAQSRNHINEILVANGQSAVSFPLANNDGSPYYNDGSTYLKNGAVRYTEYANGGHGIWVRVYGESSLYDWLLAQQSSNTGWDIGDTFLIDLGNKFNDPVDSQGRHWNGTKFGYHDTLGATVPFAQLVDGSRSTAIVSVVDPFAFHTLVTYEEDTLFDDEISNDGWITVFGATETVGAGSIAFRGLLPGGKYRVEIYVYQSNSDGGRGRMTRYKIGTNTRDLEPYANLANTAVFEEITADSTGQFDLSVFPTPGSGSRYGHISTMQLTLVSGPNGPINAPPAVTAGDDQTVIMPKGGTVLANLSGFVTDDGLPSGTLTTLWDITDGPSSSSPVIADPNEIQTPVTFDAPGNYTLRITANDTEAVRSDSINITVKLEGGTLGGETVFRQDFETSSVLSDYVETTSPSPGQFENISADTGGGTWLVNASGQLEHVRDGGTGAAAFQRVSGLSESMTFTRFEFELSVDGTSSFQDIGELILGDWSSLLANASTGSNGQRTFGLTLKARGSGKFYLRMSNDAGNHDTLDMAGGGDPIKVVWYTNMGAGGETYNGPDGFGHLLAKNASDLWIDDILVLDGVARRSQYTGSSNRAFRFRTTSSQPVTLRFDNFRVVDQAVITEPPFQQWLGQFFSELELEDVAISGDFADPDRDGLSNLLEYAFVGQPQESSHRGTIPAFSSTDGRLTLYRRPSQSDLAIELWSSEDLSNWELLATSSSGSEFITSGVQPIIIIDDAGDPATVSIEDPRIDSNDDPRPVFYRVEVSRTP